MDYDQLLLEWAQGEIRPWLAEMIESHQRYKRPSEWYADKLSEMADLIKGATLEHLYNCTPRVYAIPSHEWECGCYSEYTRDDRWMVHTYITCYHGIYTQMSHEISSWRLPKIWEKFEELAHSDEGCRYDDDHWS